MKKDRSCGDEWRDGNGVFNQASWLGMDTRLMYFGKVRVAEKPPLVFVHRSQGITSQPVYYSFSFDHQQLQFSGDVLFLLSIGVGLASDLLQATFRHTNLFDLLPIHPSIYLVWVEAQHTSDRGTLLSWLRVPPYYIFMLLPIYDTIVI